MDIGASIALVAALAALVTTYFTGRTAALLLRQSRLDAPIIHYNLTLSDHTKKISTLQFNLLTEQAEKFEIKKVRVQSPRKGRIASVVAVSSPAGRGHAIRPSEWKRTILYGPDTHSSTIFVDPHGKTEMFISVYTHLRAHHRVKSQFVMHVAMPD